jgi:hypothetical protein
LGKIFKIRGGEMLLIKDVESLKITKVKQFAVNFEIDGVCYLLHDSSESYEKCCELFMKETDEKGRYKLTFISRSHYGVYDIMPYMKHGKTNKSINKYEFIFNMQKAKLLKSTSDAIRLLQFQDEKRMKLLRKVSDIERMLR